MRGPGIIETALEYVARVWAVIPIKPRGKKPRPKDWANLRLGRNEISTNFHEWTTLAFYWEAQAAGWWMWTSTTSRE